MTDIVEFLGGVCAPPQTIYTYIAQCIPDSLHSLGLGPAVALLVLILTPCVTLKGTDLLLKHNVHIISLLFEPQNRHLARESNTAEKRKHFVLWNVAELLHVILHPHTTLLGNPNGP